MSDVSKKDVKKVARLLQDVIDTIELGGCDYKWTFAEKESGLPFLWQKLCAARDIAVSQASPGLGRKVAGHRLH